MTQNPTVTKKIGSRAISIAKKDGAGKQVANESEKTRSRSSVEATISQQRRN